jgi:tetraacyldisaccharide 4'-kinase
MVIPPITYPLLYLPAKLYEGGARARAWLYEHAWLKQHQLAVPVISVGNLTVGGTGKTPCVAWLANFLQGAGQSVAILSRGYKRASMGRVEVSDGQALLCDAAAAGDEPYLLAQSCPGVRVVVDQDRYAAGQWLVERAAVTVFLLDDDLLLVDATDDFATARLVPLGRLREPLTAMRRAAAVIVTRADQPFDQSKLEQTLQRHTRPGTPVFYASHKLTQLRCLTKAEAVESHTFAGKAVAALCGIARPERFFRDLQHLGMRVVWQQRFPDHHRYSAAEFAAAVTAAQQAKAEAILTTEKDAANLAGLTHASPLPVYAAQLAFQCQREAALQRLVQAALRPPRP